MSRTEAPAMQRSASLVPLRGLLTELDARLEEALAGTGVSASEIRPDAFIPYTAYLAILDNAARTTGRDDIGLLLGQRQTLAALGPLGRVMRHAATLGEALGEFAAFQIHNSTGATVYLMRADRDVILGYGIYDPSIHTSPHIHDLVLAVGCNLVAELTHGAVEPDEILSSRSAPKDLRPYRKLARCPIRFGLGQTGLVFRDAHLAFGLPEADSGLHQAALAELAPGLAAARRNMRGLVPHVLRHLLLTGQGKMEDVAAHLGIHPRSLRRRLRQEGTTFEEIRDEVRYAVARELLRLGALSMTDIAVTLDYASASSFVHAFRRWSGTSPIAWRDEARSTRPSGRCPPRVVGGSHQTTSRSSSPPSTFRRPSTPSLRDLHHVGAPMKRPSIWDASVPTGGVGAPRSDRRSRAVTRTAGLVVIASMIDGLAARNTRLAAYFFMILQLRLYSTSANFFILAKLNPWLLACL